MTTNGALAFIEAREHADLLAALARIDLTARRELWSGIRNWAEVVGPDRMRELPAVQRDVYMLLAGTTAEFTLPKRTTL